MTANRSTRAAGNQSGDAPTAAQTGFNARYRLAGDLDDTTVRQAADGGSAGLNPTPRGVETRLHEGESADSAEVGR
jgi:hypothetical protein